MKSNEIIKGWMAEERKHVVTLEVKAKPEGAKVSVDGVTVGVTPLQTPVFVEPGVHIVILRKDGYRAADRNVNLPAGSTDTWDVTLKEEERAVVAPTTRATPAELVHVQQPLGDPRVEPSTIAASKPNPWILVGGGAITVGSVVTGLIFNAKANRAEERAEELQRSTGRSGCFVGGTVNRSLCDELLDEGKRIDASRNASTASFLIGGAAALGTATYWFLPRRRLLSANTDIRVTAAASPERATLAISGQF